MLGAIQKQSTPRHHWPIEVKISAFNALQTMSCIQGVIHQAATATVPSLLKRLASYVVKIVAELLQVRACIGIGVCWRVGACVHACLEWLAVAVFHSGHHMALVRPRSDFAFSTPPV